MAGAALDHSDRVDWISRAKRVAPVIAAAAGRAESDRKLPVEIMAAMHEAELFRMVLPHSIGGGEAGLLEIIQALEIIAGADASTGWCLGQALGCARSAAFLDPDIVAEVFGPKDTVLAWGPPAGPMKAVAVQGGYRVSGKWQFASGLMNASWVGPNVPVFTQAGERRLDEDGKPEIRCLLIPKSSVKINDNWQVIGLRGTGSNGFEADALFVPEPYSFIRESSHYRREDAIVYRLALTGFYGMAFSSVALGVARPALDAFVELAASKIANHTTTVLRENPGVQREFARVEADLGSARAYLHETIGVLVDGAVSPEEWPLTDRARLRGACTNGIWKARDAISRAYQAAGSAAIFDKNPFEKRLRDINTIAQQAQAQPRHFENVGRTLMGLQPPGGRV
jgi:alkylation response protein AidB-like acyl-CoA dehydrogenase